MKKLEEKKEAGTPGKLSNKVRAATEINPDSARVQFGPEVVRSFARLEAMVHGSKHYDPDLLENLQELASGKNPTVHIALTEMGLIAGETMNFGGHRLSDVPMDILKETAERTVHHALQFLFGRHLDAPAPKSPTGGVQERLGGLALVGALSAQPLLKLQLVLCRQKAPTGEFADLRQMIIAGTGVPGIVVGAVPE